MRTKGLATDANAWVEGGANRTQGLAARRAVASGTTLPSQLWSLALTGLVMLTAGCSGGATLESVLKPDGADATVEDIRVFRSGTPLTPELSMRLEPGDEVQTEADSTAIIRYPNGTEVFVGPNTHIRIGSLWVLFGEIYVKARGLFRVETLYVTAGVEGTEYLLRVGSEAEMSMVVLDGAVRLTSKTASWEPIKLRRLDQGVFLPQETPRMSRVDPAEGNRVMQAINQRVPRILAPSSLAATPGLTPGGTGVAAPPPRPLSPATGTGVATTPLSPPAAGTGVVITPRPPGTGSGVVSQPRSPETGVGARSPRSPEIGVPKAPSQSPAVIQRIPPPKTQVPPRLPTVPVDKFKIQPPVDKFKIQSQPPPVPPPAALKFQRPPADFRQLQQAPPSPR